MAPLALLAGGLGRKLIVGGIIAVVLAFGAWRITAHFAEHERRAQEITALRSTLAENERALAEIQAGHAATVAALQGELSAARERTEQFNDIRKEVNRAPSSADGGVAPVLRHALERLRLDPTGHADTGSEASAPE